MSGITLLSTTLIGYLLTNWTGESKKSVKDYHGKAINWSWYPFCIIWAQSLMTFDTNFINVTSKGVLGIYVSPNSLCSWPLKTIFCCITIELKREDGALFSSYLIILQMINILTLTTHAHRYGSNLTFMWRSEIFLNNIYISHYKPTLTL